MSTTVSTTARSRRPDRSGTLFEFQRNGRTFWRATGYIVDGNDSVKIVAEGVTSDKATANLHKKMNRKQEERAVFGGRALRLTAEDRKITVERAVTRWLDAKLDAVNRGELTLNTWKVYEAKARNYLIPHLGDRPLALLTHHELYVYFQTILPEVKTGRGGTPLGTTARRGVYGVLNDSIKAAIAREEIDRNPLAAVPIPPKNKRTEEEVKRLRDAASNLPARIIKHIEGKPGEFRWLLGLHGLRQSEVLGLTDDSIRWNRKRKNDPVAIHIKQQLDRVTVRHGCGSYDAAARKWECGRQANNCPKRIGDGKLFIRPATKTKSGNRELPLSPRLKAALLRQLQERSVYREREDYQPLPGEKMDSLIFVKPTGVPIRPQDDRKAWAKLLKEVKADKFKVHDARHMAATVAFGEDILPEKIALIFGWSPRQLREMLQTYAHPSASTIQNEMDVFSQALSERSADRRKRRSQGFNGS